MIEKRKKDKTIIPDCCHCEGYTTFIDTGMVNCHQLKTDIPHEACWKANIEWKERQ